MTYEYDESCNAYGPEPHPDDVYKPNSADKARWAAVWARMAPRRQQAGNDVPAGRPEFGLQASRQECFKP